MRLLVAFLSAALLAGGCASGTERRAAPLDRESGGPGPTTTTVVPVTTTTEPPTPAVDLPPPPPLAQGDVGALTTPTGIVVPVVGRGDGGWLVSTPCDRTVTVAGGIEHRGAHIVLDAGHGGDEPGAVGPGGTKEKDLNLAVVAAAKEALEAHGYAVIPTRTADYRVTLQTRAAIATELGAAAFVSVHFNAEPDTQWPQPGSETYYQVASADSKRLAGLMYEEAVTALAPYGVAWVADTDAGAKYRRSSSGADYYGILRRSAGVPAVLAELGFVSNAEEEALYSRRDVQQRLGAAVALAAARYLTSDEPGSGFTEPYPRESPAGSGGGTRGCVDPVLE